MSHWEIVDGMLTLCTKEEEGRRCIGSNGCNMWIEYTVLPDGHERMSDDEVIAVVASEFFDDKADQVGLEQLLAEFEAIVDEVAVMLSPQVFNAHDMKDPDRYLAEWGNIAPAEPCELRAAELARRYIIARDFDIFDPKEADMMWRLQDGGAL